MDQQLTAPGQAESASRGHELSYDGKGGEIGKIALTNGLLGLVTLGVYRFWGKTRLRRYLWSHVSLDGDRLEYTGRGIELFLGFLVVTLFLAVLFGGAYAIGLALGLSFAEAEGLKLIFFLILVLLIPVAIYRARRYRLSRTTWRGIRGGQTGSAFKYALMSIGLILLVTLTLGFAYPYYRTALQRYCMKNTWFGDQGFEFDARAWDLFGKWVIALVLYIFTAGFSLFWYWIVEFRYYASRTRFMGAQFSSKLDTGRMIGIVILAYIAMIVYMLVMIGVAIALAATLAPDTLKDFGEATGDPSAQPPIGFVIGVLIFGLVTALGVGVIQTVFVIQPMLAEVIKSLSIEGEIDFETLAQSAQRGPRHGEGLADALDLSPI